MWKIRTTKGSATSIPNGVILSDCFETNEVNEDDQGQEPRRSKRTAAAVAKIKILD